MVKNFYTPERGSPSISFSINFKTFDLEKIEKSKQQKQAKIRERSNPHEKKLK